MTVPHHTHSGGDSGPQLEASNCFADGSVNVALATAQAFKAEYNVAASLGVWVHGVKIELTRTANIQPATGGWLGGQFVLNAGSSGYDALNKGTYVLQAVFKGSDTNPNGVDIHVARFETQSAGKVSDIVHILANTGTTIVGSMLYMATHINPGVAMILLNAQSTTTVPVGLKLMAGAGSTFVDGIQLAAACSGNAISITGAITGNAIAISGTIGGYGVSVTSQCDAALYAVYNIATQVGAWVHGVKVEVTRTADIQPATGGWFGAQFVLNAGSSGYAALNKSASVLAAIFKGSDTNPNGQDIHVGRFELQSAGKVSDIVHILANTGCSIIGHMLYLAAHINTNAILINVQSSATIAKGLSFMAGSGATLTSLLYASGAGSFTNFLEVSATGKGGVTVGTTDIAADLTADAYLTLKVGATPYKILAWAA